MAELFSVGISWLYVYTVSGLPSEFAKNVSDSAKSNYWVLVCRCWNPVSILNFRNGVITDIEQGILKISLACPYECVSFIVTLLECLTEGSRESSTLSGSTGSTTQSFQEWLGPMYTSLSRCMLGRPDTYWEISLCLMESWTLMVPALCTQKPWPSGIQVPFKCFQQKCLRLTQIQTPKL